MANTKMMSGGAVAGGGGGSGQKGGNAWSQIDQLLTCAICLDRYRNPKLLPCQHTFCMEPCIEGLIDYVRRQIKCPECRAEHRIPYQGIQGYPTNVTLMRFLELHFEVTGEIPDLNPGNMERCGVCTEKSYLGHCAHCEKKVCTECKDAHMDIMKREISRINNQVKRGLNRLQDALGQVTKSSELLQMNCASVTQDIEDTFRRLQKALKAREEALKSETQLFLQNESKSAELLKENLDAEVTNIQSNCDLVEQHVTEHDDWEDVELLEYKDILLRTLEFLRNYDTDQADFNRRLKFQLGNEPEVVHHTVANTGELIVNAPNFPGSCVTNSLGVTSVGTVLARSKSDHRLAQSLSASQLQQRHHEGGGGGSGGYLGLAHRGSGGQGSDTESREGRSSPLTRRRTAGEHTDSGSRFRGGRDADEDRSPYGQRRSQTKDYGEVTRSWQRDEVEHSSGISYRSRFARERDDDDSGSKSVRFSRHQETSAEPPLPREKVFETEDATRGPISGITKLMDSSKVLERLQQHAQAKLKKEALSKLPPPPQQTTPVFTSMQYPQRPATNRQVSEEDEVAKQKAQNKAASASTSTTTTNITAQQEPASRPTPKALQRQESTVKSQVTKTSDMRTGSNSNSESAAHGEESSTSSSVPKRPGSRGSGTSVLDKVPTNRDNVKVDSSLQRPVNEMSSATSATTTTAAGDQSYRRKRLTDTTAENVTVKSTTETPAVTKQESDSESESEESADESNPVTQDANGGKQNTLDDLTGQEKPNYFRFRTAHYSRTPSNSSVNVSNDSQDESGRSNAASPTSNKSQQPFSTSKLKSNTNPTTTNEHETKESSSESSSSLESLNKSSNLGNTKEPLAQSSSLPLNYTKTSAYDVKPKSEAAPSLRKAQSVEKNEVPSAPPTKPRFVSRFLPRSSSLNQENKPDSSSSDSEDDGKYGGKSQKDHPSSISDLLARSANARKDPNSSSTSATGRSSYGRGDREDSWRSGNSYLHSSRDDYKKDVDGRNDTHEGRYSSLASKYLNRSRPSLHDDERDTSIASKYGGGGNYANRYLSKSKSSAVLTGSFDKDDYDDHSGSARRSSLAGRDNSIGVNSSQKEKYRDHDNTTTSSSRYAARNSSTKAVGQLGRSKSSHEIAVEDDDDDVDDVRTYSSRFERPSDYTSTRRKSYQSREQSPDDGVGGGGSSTNASGLSSWARYLKSKYGNKTKSDSNKDPYHSPVGRSRSSHALHSREASSESSDDESGVGTKLQHNTATKDSSISYPTGYRAGMTSSRSGGDPNQVEARSRGTTTTGYENPRSTYQHKQRTVMRIGSRGSEQGAFTWPRGIAVGPDSSIVVADSSNHRVQVFNSQGTFCKEFGTYGSAEGEFDCLAGVAVNRIGQYIISDRYNHRIQVFDPSGRFLRCFGSQGTSDGKLNCPWGIATDSLGFIYVCDKENHRIQVFQSDGTFVGKFGSLGNKPGQLEHPHYVAVSNTNKVIISDSNNHRIQIFDVNGKVISSFGCEGADSGQFKFPRGVAVDDQGYIIVGDSGNNRIQIFQSDGVFIKSFGAWGSGDSEFKGLEGVSVMQDGRILVCDRENHRVQIF